MQVVPQIVFKVDRESNVLDRSEVALYGEAKALLAAMEERVAQYQAVVEKRVVQMVKDKEVALNDYIKSAAEGVLADLRQQQVEWLGEANKRLEQMLREQAEAINSIEEGAKRTIAARLQSRLSSLNHSETLVAHLVDTLHTELGDMDKLLNVEIVELDGGGVEIKIEDDDRLVSINTKSLVSELQSHLEQL